MADEYISVILINFLTPDQSVQGFIIRKIISILVHPHDLFDHRWFYKRKQIKIHISICIMQNDFFYIFCLCSRWLTDHIYLLSGQNISKTVDPRRTVVISADHHDHRIRNSLRQFFKKPVKNFDCFGRRNGFIINVSRNHNRIRLFPTCCLDDLTQNIFLIFPQITVH